MFGIFKKKSKIDILYKKYDQLKEEAYNLSRYDRIQSDLKTEEAEKVLSEIKALEKLSDK